MQNIQTSILDKATTTVDDFIFARRFIHNEFWIEGISNGSIIWDEVAGWNLYYRIAGVAVCSSWHIVLYNNTFKRCYYINNLMDGECRDVEMRVVHKISQNIFMYDLFKIVPQINIPTTLVLPPPRDYLYFCEPPIAYDIDSLFKSFYCKQIDVPGDIATCATSPILMIDDSEQLIVVFPDEKKKKNSLKRNENSMISFMTSFFNHQEVDDDDDVICDHPPGKTLRMINIHSKEKTIKFSIEDNSHRQCVMCKLLPKLKTLNKNGTNGLLFSYNLSSLFLNY